MVIKQEYKPGIETISRNPHQAPREQFNQRRWDYLSRYRTSNNFCDDKIPYHAQSLARSHGNIEPPLYVGPKAVDKALIARNERFYRVIQAQRDYLFDRSGWHHPMLYCSPQTRPSVSDIHRIKPAYPHNLYPLPIFLSHINPRKQLY